MSTAREDIFAFFPETLFIPSGGTMTINPIPGQISAILKYVSGGSLAVIKNPGSSYAVAGQTLIGTSFTPSFIYTLGTNEVLNVMSSGPIVLFAAGVTCVANLLRGQSQGT